MTMLIEEECTRIGGFEIRELEATESLSMLSGIAVPYATPTDIGWYVEEFARGALNKSINTAADRRYRNGKGLPLLLFHNEADMPIGVSAEWHDEEKGLRGVWRLADTDRAQEAARMARDGFLNHMSIRFQPVDDDWTRAKDFNPELGAKYKDHVLRREARLLETSLVSTPAFQEASVQFVRSVMRPAERKPTRRAVDTWREELERLR